MVGSRSSPVLVFALYAACIFGLPELAQAQNGTNAVTDPAEVRVLNSIFQEWGISAPSAQWNISGQPCSGAAIGSIPIDDGDHNPFIKCDCLYDNNTTCHITALMGKRRITSTTNGSKREWRRRSCNPGRAINGTKGKRSSARPRFAGPVTRSRSKMNNIGTPRKSPRKHQAKGLSQPKAPPAVWSRENEEHLIFILLGLAQKGVRPSFGSHVNKITDDLNNRIDNCRYTTRQVTNKIGGLKQCHKDFTMLLSGKVGTGFGWDHTTNTVTNSDDKWEQLKFEFGADKYYKFKYNPPRLFPLLTSIFAGSYATGELAHASTQDPPDTDDERGDDNPLLDLNNPCAVIDLEELDMPRPGMRMPPNKGKRRATPLNSSRSSKRTNTTTEELEVGKMSGEWSEMKREFDLLNCKLKTAKGSSATSKPDIIAEAMSVLNDVAAEHPVTEENYWRAANSFTDRTKARVFIGMDPIKRVGWVMRGINMKDL